MATFAMMSCSTTGVMMPGEENVGAWGESSRAFRVFGVEARFELRVRAAQLVDHLLCPVEVLALAFQRPSRRRRAVDVAHVGDLVGELDELRLEADLRGVIDLRLLAL